MSRALSLLVLVLAGCGAEPPESVPLPEIDIDVATIASGAVSGRVGGEDFVARVVRHRTTRGRTTLLFDAEREPADCGLAETSEEPRVFVVLPAEHSLGVVPEVSAHYEAREGGRWVGVGRSAAVVELTSADGRVMEGRMRACFADAHGSCVEGSFVAERCRSAVRGTTREL